MGGKITMGLETEINSKKDLLEKALYAAKDIKEINSIKIEYLKKYVKSLYSELKSVSAEEKKVLGKVINEFKNFAEAKITAAEEKFKSQKAATKYDVSIFKDNIAFGSKHPLVKLYKKIEEVFVGMGFSVVQGPEIELDKYNFEKLNLPPHHPARDMQDTFYISAPNVLLRSHTSSVQIRTMEKMNPPVQIISPGTVYRVDDIDPQHTPMFYQVEGLMVAENISFANLKAVLIRFLKEVFGDDVSSFYRIKRLRFLDHKPAELVTTYIPKYLIENLNDYDLTKNSLFDILEREKNIYVDYAEKLLRAVNVSKDVAKYLEIVPNTAVQFVHTVTYNTKGIPIEYSDAFDVNEFSNFKLIVKKNRGHDC